MSQTRKLTVMRVAREKSGRTQGEIADLMGVSQKQISAWENLRAPIPARRRQELAAVLGVKPERLDKMPSISF